MLKAVLKFSDIIPIMVISINKEAWVLVLPEPQPHTNSIPLSFYLSLSLVFLYAK